MAKTAKTTNDKREDSKIKAVKVAAPAVTITTSQKSGIAIIPGVQTESFKTLIIGASPLIAHMFASKGIAAVRAKHMGEASGGRTAKDPHANFMGARYIASDGWDGVPAGGVKAAIAAGCNKQSGVSKTAAKGALRVHADDPLTNLVRILGPDNARAAERIGDPGAWPQMREDVVRNANGVIDIRHRPEYWPWAMLLDIEYFGSFISARQALQALAVAGFMEGLGEWRPGSKKSLSGTYGTWRLATQDEVAAFENGELFAAVHRSMKRAA